MRSGSCVKWGPPEPREGKIKFASPPPEEIQIKSAFAVWPPSKVALSRSYALPRKRTMRLPSGDHTGLLYSPIDFDTCWAEPPPAGIFQSCPPAAVQLTYAIHFPSGDQAGWYACASPVVSCVGLPLGRSATYKCVIAENASFFPSGDSVAS